MASLTIEALTVAKRSRCHDVNIKDIISRKLEKGYEFDPEKNFAYFSHAIILFRIVSGMLLSRDESIRDAIPEGALNKFMAYECQIYEGPNKKPAPQCINPVLSFFGIKCGEISMQVWQEWQNLGSISTKAAASKFINEFKMYHPGFMETPFSSDSTLLTVRTAMRVLAAFLIQRMYRKNVSSRASR